MGEFCGNSMNKYTAEWEGRTVGNFTIVEVILGGATRAKVRCMCGTEKVVSLSHIVVGIVKSCGCILLRGQQNVPDGYKKCPGCLVSKRYSEFFKSKKNSDKASDRCKVCTSEYGKFHYHKDVEKSRLRARERVKALKRSVIDAYGGVCACCSEYRLPFLTIEHSWRDGKKDREGLPGYKFYHSLVKSNFPKNKGLLVYCMNCNFSTRNGASCPHKDGDGDGDGDIV